MSQLEEDLKRYWDAIGSEPPRVTEYTLEEDRYWKAVSSVIRNRADPTPANCQVCRQFACACCRALDKWLVSSASVDALAIIERFVSGKASFDELVAARNAARRAARRLKKEWSTPEFASAMAVCGAASNDHQQAAHRVAGLARIAGLDASTMERICIAISDPPPAPQAVINSLPNSSAPAPNPPTP